MDEKKMVDEEVTSEEERSVDGADSRRDFLTKLASAAGAVVAAGLLTGGEAEAQTAATRAAPATRASLKSLGRANIASAKLKNGLALSVTDKQIVQSIARESLGINQPGAEVMELSLTWK